MAKSNAKAAEAQQAPEAAEAQQEPQTTNESPQQPGDRLQYAREKLARMEETQKLCFRHQNDLERLASELKGMKYNEFEINQILEPKGQRSLPGYLKSEIERQRKYVNYLSARAKPAGSHTEALEQSQQMGGEEIHY